MNEIIYPEIWSEARLSSLPKNTLGFHYFRYMSVNGFLGSGRPEVHFIDHEEKAYAMTRYREIHDFCHVLVDLPPTILGEVIVKWNEYFQTGLPMNLLGGMFGPLQLSSDDRKILRHVFPWILENAKRSKILLNVYIEKHLEDDIDEFRTMSGFTKCPIPSIQFS